MGQGWVGGEPGSELRIEVVAHVGERVRTCALVRFLDSDPALLSFRFDSILICYSGGRMVAGRSLV